MRTITAIIACVALFGCHRDETGMAGWLKANEGQRVRCGYSTFDIEKVENGVVRLANGNAISAEAIVFRNAVCETVQYRILGPDGTTYHFPYNTDQKVMLRVMREKYGTGNLTWDPNYEFEGYYVKQKP